MLRFHVFLSNPSATNMPLDEPADTPILYDDIQKVLTEQYDVTVSFCNAQTSLLNSTARSNHNSTADHHGVQEEIHRCLDDYISALRNVQTNFTEIRKVEKTMRNVPHFRRLWSVFKEHTDRTLRVLRTVQQAGGGVWSSYHGISLSQNDSDTVTVALATLRASIDSMREVLTAYVKE